MHVCVQFQITFKLIFIDVCDIFLQSIICLTTSNTIRQHIKKESCAQYHLNVTESNIPMPACLFHYGLIFIGVNVVVENEE